MNPSTPTDMQAQQPAYGPVVSILIVVALFLGAQIAGSALFVTLLLLQPGYSGLSGAAIEQRIMDNPWLYLPLMLLVQGIVVMGLSAVMKAKRLRWKDLGLGRFLPSYVLYAIAGYVAVFAVNAIVTAVLSGLLTGVDFEQ
ncbi:hypothetical protein KC957_02975, partial [Candidatus Saccharibacteria bacterium]|nr:hypothetical protein [Candidatus Saccharibacteria bacterium]